MIHYNKNFHPQDKPYDPKHTIPKANDSGWVTKGEFLDYLKREVLAKVRSKLTEDDIILGVKPVLMYDNHKSHLDHYVLEEIFGNGCIAIGIMPNATTWLQPLDCGFFGPFKDKWDKIQKPVGFSLFATVFHRMETICEMDEFLKSIILTCWSNVGFKKLTDSEYFTLDLSEVYTKIPGENKYENQKKRLEVGEISLQKREEWVADESQRLQKIHGPKRAVPKNKTESFVPPTGTVLTTPLNRAKAAAIEKTRLEKEQKKKEAAERKAKKAIEKAVEQATGIKSSAKPKVQKRKSKETPKIIKTPKITNFFKRKSTDSGFISE